ncbi:MAG: ribonuclease J [Eggerthellaceae bacterium]|nr:ribonuclease J [Eggerthellaceae bacterium]
MGGDNAAPRGSRTQKPRRTHQAPRSSATSAQSNEKRTSQPKNYDNPSSQRKSYAPKKTASRNDGAVSYNKSIRQKTQRHKHVNIEHVRPELSYGDDVQERNYKAARTRKSGKVAKDARAVLKVIPLGGLDGIGKNMTAFECGGDIVLVDAGLMFPDDDQPGVDLILPDYTYILENEHRLRAILITHGHEDHIGSLPYLLKDLSNKVPIYGSKITLGLIEGKLTEHRIKAKLQEVGPRDEIKVGSFVVDFFSVNHSIPGAFGIFMQTPAGNVLHTGDFKLDLTPIDHVVTDFASITRFSEIGIDLMLSDSTNAMRTTFTPSEAEVGKTLRSVIESARGRVIVASFASHIHRLQQIVDAAVANGRKVVVTGRSMIQNTDIARKLGYLHIQDTDLVDAYYMKDIPPEKVVVMCTGSQGEPLSALGRIANGDHKTIHLDAGDTVIISATPVPGNEKAVTRIVNNLAKIGCDVYDKSRALVHVSGHGGAEELKIMLAMARPRYFMPVHGESAHLRAHARLAQAIGIPSERIFICDNGDSLELSARGVRRGAPVESGIIYVDGLSVGDTTVDVLDERSQLGEMGLVSIAAAVGGRKLQGSVEVEMRGIAGKDVSSLQSEARRRATDSIRKGLEAQEKGARLEKRVRDNMQQFLWESTKQKPIVVVNVISLT